MSLQSTYQSRKNLLADNLVTMGVQASGTEGLTTLINKVLDIPVSPVTKLLTVTSTKDILSYADSDTCTFTATYTENGSPVSGKTVTFKAYKNGTLVENIGSDTTDASGEASVSYSSKGAGDLSIECECNLLQETYVIEDCTFYDPCTSNSKASYWTIPSGVTSSYSSDGWRISANAYKQIKLTEKITTDTSVEFTVTSKGGTYSPVLIYAYTNGETTPNQTIITDTNSTTSFTALTTTISHGFKLDTPYRVEYTSSTLNVYEDDTLIATASNSVGLPTRFEIHQGANSRYAVYKDIKVKPL